MSQLESYAIKNQLGHPKLTARDFGKCSPVLYGIRIVGFYAQKGPIIGALMP